jgi:hypothetical protein
MLHNSDDIAGKEAERESLDAQARRSKCTRIKSFFLFREASSNMSKDGVFENPEPEPESSSFQSSSERSESYPYSQICSQIRHAMSYLSILLKSYVDATTQTQR